MLINEYSFLYCCLNNEDALKETRYVDASIFSHPTTRQVYIIISNLIKQGFTPNLTTIRSYLDDESYEMFVVNIPKDVNISDYPIYLDSIKNQYSYCQLEKAGAILESGIQNKTAPLDIANSIQDQLRTIYQAKNIGGITKPSDVIQNITNEFAGDYSGYYIGLQGLDEQVGPLELGNMCCVAARPSMGKSSILLQFLINHSIYGNTPTAFVSLEMSAKSLMRRIISNVGGISLTSIRLRKLTDRQAETYNSVKDQIENAPLFIIDNTYTIQGIEANLELLKAQKPDLTFVAFDYIQLMANENTSIANLMKECKRIAKKLGLIWIFASQLNRLVETRDDKRPMLSDLRDSGAIEQDMDVVIFPFREAYYDKDKQLKEGHKSHTELIVAKNRDGEVGTVYSIFDKNIQRFLPYKQKNP